MEIHRRYTTPYTHPALHSRARSVHIVTQGGVAVADAVGVGLHLNTELGAGGLRHVEVQRRDPDLARGEGRVKVGRALGSVQRDADKRRRARCLCMGVDGKGVCERALGMALGKVTSSKTLILANTFGPIDRYATQNQIRMASRSSPTLISIFPRLLEINLQQLLFGLQPTCQ